MSSATYAWYSFLLFPEASWTWSGHPSSTFPCWGFLGDFDLGPLRTLAGNVGAVPLERLRKSQLFIIFLCSILVYARDYTRTNGKRQEGSEQEWKGGEGT